MSDKFKIYIFKVENNDSLSKSLTTINDKLTQLGDDDIKFIGIVKYKYDKLAVFTIGGILESLIKFKNIFPTSTRVLEDDEILKTCYQLKHLS